MALLYDPLQRKISFALMLPMKMNNTKEMVVIGTEEDWEVLGSISSNAKTRSKRQWKRFWWQWGMRTKNATIHLCHCQTIINSNWFFQAAAESDTFQKPRAHFDDDMSPNHLYSYLYALCSRNFLNVKLRQHSVEILQFVCHSYFTWNQMVKKCQL